MSFMHPILALVLLPLGLIGGLGALTGLRLRQNWLIATGISGCVLGYGLFAAALFGWVRFDRSVGMLARWAGSTVPAVSPQDRARAVLAGLSDGTATESEFAALLNSISWRSPTLDVIQMAILQDQLPAANVAQFTRWFIAAWPQWSVGPSNQLDMLPTSILHCASLSPQLRTEFLDFLIAQHGDRSRPIPLGWTDAIEEALLSGPIDAIRVRNYVESMASVELRVTSPEGPAYRGELVTIELPDKSGNSTDPFDGHLPWSGTATLADEGTLHAGGAAWLSPFARLGRSGLVFAEVVAPQTSGPWDIPVDITVQLTRDAVRGHYQMNPHLRPEGLRLKDLPDVRVTKRITVPVTVVDRVAPPPTLVRNPEIHATAAEWIKSEQVAHIYTSDGGRKAAHVLHLKSAPANLAVRVSWMINGKEVPGTWFHAAKGAASRDITYDVPVGAFEGGDVDIILRTDATLLTHSRRYSELYDDPEPIHLHATAIPW